MHSKKIHQRFYHWFTPISIVLFMGLYIYAASLYPGGSQADINSVGFDWMNNYWCNLMNEKAMNGQLNPARNIAIPALVILCFGLMVFFIHFSRKLTTNRFRKKIIIICGIISMVFAMLIFTNYHNLMTTLSSIFGIFVVLSIIWEIQKSRLSLFKLSGVLCIALLALNNYIYYSKQLIEYLPLIQKITFFFVLLWIVTLNQKISTQK